MVSFYECPECYRSVLVVERRIMGFPISTTQMRAHPGTDTCHYSFTITMAKSLPGVTRLRLPLRNVAGRKDALLGTVKQ